MTRARAGLIRAATVAAALLPAGALAGSDDAGSSAASFLAVPPGASAPGMGGATLALGGDLAAVFANPATLGMVPGLTFALSHSQLPGGTRHEWASAGGRLGRLATRWALSGLYAGQDAIEGRDAFNQPTGDISASSLAISGTLAQPLGGFATLGLGAKFVSENLASTTGSGATLDAGLTAHAGPLSLGASAQNVFGSMGYGGVRYYFPTNYGVGLALDHSSGLRFVLDANFPRDYYNDLRGGVEYRWHDKFALRGGYRYEIGADASNEPLGGPTFGCGAGMDGFWIDYAFLPSSAGDSEQRFSLVLTPGAMGGSPAGLRSKTAR